jgi:hypothetical protein
VVKIPFMFSAVNKSARLITHAAPAARPEAGGAAHRSVSLGQFFPIHAAWITINLTYGKLLVIGSR